MQEGGCLHACHTSDDDDACAPAAACYCRLVYLDADMLVLRNLDALFDLPPGFYAGMGLEWWGAPSMSLPVVQG